MRKKKIYLDTTVISHLHHEDRPDWMADTLELWEILKVGKYDVYISDVVAGELANCAEPKRTKMFAHLEEIQYNEIMTGDNEEITHLAIAIKQQGLLPPRSVNDRLHIATAMYAGCNILLSWNFNHLVNVATIDGARVIAALNNLNPVDIFSPTMLLERSD
ncbi:MAG: PIN domain-containing protein [Oscillospiraceae bacterium]|nr:PIN domain-containing protein [Oscillospiraceae bacterium]